MITTTKTNTAVFDRRRFFWIGQTIFWCALLTENIITGPQNRASFNAFSALILIILEGFLVSCGLRFVYKKYQWHRLPLTRLVAFSLTASIGGSLLWSTAKFAVEYLIFGPPEVLPVEYISFIFSIYYTLLFLWSILYLGFKIWEEWNNQKFQLEHERALLKTSQLETLRYQLNPHFLFNTLSSLRGLIKADPDRARDMVTQIAEFLRYSLLEGKNNEVPLMKEIEIIKQYLSIEQVRYNEDLIVTYDISSETNDLMMPIFLIHPLIENAVKHGMQTTALPLRISIMTKMIDQTAVIEVVNSGRWIENGKSEDTGIGLRNIRQRLAHSFPDRHSFDIVKDANCVRAVISMQSGKK